VRFSLPCVIAVALAARLAGRDSFTAAGEWAGIHFAPSEKTIRRVCGLAGHDLADDLLCGWTGELAAISGVLSPARVQERRRDKARKAKARARKAARRERGARELSGKQARKAAKRERKAAAAAIAASAAAIAGGRAKLPAGSAFGRVPVPATHPALPAAAYGDPRHVPALRGLGADGKASRGAKVKSQEAPQHLGFFWHGTRLNAAQRAVDRKTNETTVIGPVIDEMDLAGVCLTVDALHSLVDLDERVLACGGHVIFVIKGNQPRTYQALNAIAWEQVPVAAATFEADRGRVETRTIQVAAAPAGLKYPGMEQAALIERYTTSKDKKGMAVTRSETVLVLTTASADQAPPADLLALNRGHWAATEATHYIRDVDLREDSSRARGPGTARFMATVGNTVLNLLRIHGVTNIAAERRHLNGSDRQILKRMGLSTG
jgi:predicted transposase YbfD/YdcC